MCSKQLLCFCTTWRNYMAVKESLTMLKIDRLFGLFSHAWTFPTSWWTPSTLSLPLHASRAPSTFILPYWVLWITRQVYRQAAYKKIPPALTWPVLSESIWWQRQKCMRRFPRPQSMKISALESDFQASPAHVDEWVKNPHPPRS